MAFLGPLDAGILAAANASLAQISVVMGQTTAMIPQMATLQAEQIQEIASQAMHTGMFNQLIASQMIMTKMIQGLQQGAIKSSFNTLKQFASAHKTSLAIGAIMTAANVTGGEIKKSVNAGFTDMVELIMYTFEFIKTHIKCGVYFSQNIRKCVGYYIVDAILQILYLPVRIFKFFFHLITGKDVLERIEGWLFDQADIVDTYWFTMFKFHLLYWPKQVRDDCFNCKRFKATVLAGKAEEVVYDFGYVIPKSVLDSLGNLSNKMNDLKNPLEAVNDIDFSEYDIKEVIRTILGF